MTIKSGKEEEFKNIIVKQLTTSAIANTCLHYAFYQNLENSREFILHEKWEDKKTWDGHINNLVKIFGEKAERSILPKKLEEYFETTESILYNED